MPQYEAVSSPTVALQVLAYPMFTIDWVSQSHTQARSGTTVGCTAQVSAPPDLGGYYNLVIKDNVGVLIQTGWRWLSRDEIDTPSLYWVMPARDLIGLRAECYNQGNELTSTYTMTPITLLIPTALTMTLDKTAVAPSELVTATGKLTRTDTGGGLAGQTVRIIYDATEAKVVTTASDGSYSAPFNAPATVKSYNVYARFAGAATAGLAASESQKVALAVGILAIPSWVIGVVAPLALGTILNLASARRR